MKGYTLDKRNPLKPYIAQINIAGTLKHLGSFATPEEATAAYDKARAENPRNPRSGGSSEGYHVDRLHCPVCRGSYAKNKLRMHYAICSKRHAVDNSFDKQLEEIINAYQRISAARPTYRQQGARQARTVGYSGSGFSGGSWGSGGSY